MQLYSRSQQRVNHPPPLLHRFLDRFIKWEAAHSQGRLWKTGLITCELSGGWEFTVNGEGRSNPGRTESRCTHSTWEPHVRPHPCHPVSPHHSKSCRGGWEMFSPSLMDCPSTAGLPRLNFGPCWSGCDWRGCATPGLCHLLKKATRGDCRATRHEPCSSNHGRIVGSREGSVLCLDYWS